MSCNVNSVNFFQSVLKLPKVSLHGLMLTLLTLD